MGDPSGPWRHRGDGDGDGTDRHTPRHRRSRPAGGYDLGYGQQPRGGGDDVTGPAATSGNGGPRTPRYVDTSWEVSQADTGQIPAVGHAVPTPAVPIAAGPGPAAPGSDVPGPAGAGAAARRSDVAGPAVPIPASSGGPQPAAPRASGPSADVAHPAITPPADRGPSTHAPVPGPPVYSHDWPDPGYVTPDGGHSDDGYGYRYGHNGDGHGHGHGHGHGYGHGDENGRGNGAVGSVRAVAAEAAWRYRSAPLWVRISADVAAASLVLVLIVGVSLALRQDGPEQATSAETRPRTTTTVGTTTTTVATTTTTLATTTTAPTTTTTAPPTTTTTAAPIVPPPTEAPTTTAPTTTTTEPVDYRSCRDALEAGALPLVAGDPGYHPRLDDDGDGEACDDFDDWGGRGD